MTKKFQISTEDGTIEGTLTLTEDVPGEVMATTDWWVAAGVPDELCRALHKDIVSQLLGTNGD